MADQEAIAEFLRTSVPFTQPLPSVWWYGASSPIQWHPLPTSQDLARYWFDNTEIRALRLGTWLRTTDGQIIVAAVESVLAPGYRQEFELLVDALQLAAEAQSQEGVRKAGAVALATACVGAFGMMLLRPSDLFKMTG
ncbi:MAG TPA: hypothetical protein VN927_03305 [Gemmatimonadaceae bacterium]|nr:hypothetical protein [Gemmatimonadaceae bacterium]